MNLGALARTLKKAQADRPVLFFEGSPVLQRFLDDEARRICVLAANRIGKTRHAAWKLSQQMRKIPGLQARAVGPTNKMVADVHSRYLNQFLAGDLASNSKYFPGRGFNNNNIIFLKNGSECQLMSYEQDSDAHAGASKNIVWLDEPAPRAHFQENVARVMDVEGAVWCTLTAVGRPVKWLRGIVEGKDAEPDAPTWSFYNVPFRPQFVPWYNDRQIAAYMAEMRAAPWQYEQRVNGAWEGTTDTRRLSAFDDRAVLPLVAEPLQLLSEGWDPQRAVRLVLAVDHGEDAGHSVWLLIAYQVVRRTEYGSQVKIRVLSEWSNPKRISAEQEARQVREMVRGAGLDLDQIDFAVGDINSAGKNSYGARSMNELYERHFARLMGARPESPALVFRGAIKGPDSIDTGLIAMNQLLAAASLEVYEGCEVTVEAARHWAGKDDEMKHAVDAFRYGVTAIISEEGVEPARLEAA